MTLLDPYRAEYSIVSRTPCDMSTPYLHCNKDRNACWLGSWGLAGTTESNVKFFAETFSTSYTGIEELGTVIFN